jgi:hypothetical protein
LKTEVDYLEGGSYHLYQEVNKDLVVLPSITLTLTGPNYAIPGRKIIYHFDVKHNGTEELQEATVTADLFGATWSYGLGTMGVGETRSFDVEYIVLKDAPDLLINTGLVTGKYGTRTVMDSSSWSLSVVPEESEYPVSGDTFISSSYLQVWHGKEWKQEKYLNFGTNEGLSVVRGMVGGAGGLLYWRGTLIHIDLSSIPTDAEIEKAELFLYHYSVWSDQIGIHRMTQGWTELGATWYQPCEGCDPWWQGWYDLHGVEKNYVNQPTDVRWVGPMGWVSWDVTEDVQRFVNGEPNLGWFLKSAIRYPSDWTSVSFYSKDKREEAYRPYLRIQIK